MQLPPPPSSPSLAKYIVLATRRPREDAVSSDSDSERRARASSAAESTPRHKRRRTEAPVPAAAAADTMRLENNGVTTTTATTGNGVASSNGAGASGKADSLHTNGVVRNGKLSESGASPKTDYFGHDREEVTRILIQALGDLGYRGAATALEDESDYTLETPYVSSFRHSVLKGDWGNAERLLEGMEIHPDADINVSTGEVREGPVSGANEGAQARLCSFSSANKSSWSSWRLGIFQGHCRSYEMSSPR